MPDICFNHTKPPAAESLQLPLGCSGTQILDCKGIQLSAQHVALVCTCQAGSCLVADAVVVGWQPGNATAVRKPPSTVAALLSLHSVGSGCHFRFRVAWGGSDWSNNVKFPCNKAENV
jgi:hypothetical protein